MDLNARVDINCGRKEGRTDGWTKNRMPISHLAKAGATKMSKFVWSGMIFFFCAEDRVQVATYHPLQNSLSFP